MTKTYLSLSKRKSIRWRLRYHIDPTIGMILGLREEMGSYKARVLLYPSFTSASSCSVSASPHPPFTLPKLPPPLDPIPPTGPHLGVHITTSPSGVGHKQSTCSPPPAKIPYPEFVFRPQPPSRTTVSFIFTGFCSVSLLLALRITPDVENLYLPSGPRPRPKFCFQEVAVWVRGPPWSNRIGQRDKSGRTNMASRSHPLWLGAILRDIGTMLTTT